MEDRPAELWVVSSRNRATSKRRPVAEKNTLRGTPATPQERGGAEFNRLATASCSSRTSSDAIMATASGAAPPAMIFHSAMAAAR